MVDLSKTFQLLRKLTRVRYPGYQNQMESLSVAYICLTYFVYLIRFKAVLLKSRLLSPVLK